MRLIPVNFDGNVSIQTAVGKNLNPVWLVNVNCDLDPGKGTVCYLWHVVCSMTTPNVQLFWDLPVQDKATDPRQGSSPMDQHVNRLLKPWLLS